MLKMYLPRKAGLLSLHHHQKQQVFIQFPIFEKFFFLDVIHIFWSPTRPQSRGDYYPGRDSGCYKPGSRLFLFHFHHPTTNLDWRYMYFYNYIFCSFIINYTTINTTIYLYFYVIEGNGNMVGHFDATPGEAFYSTSTIQLGPLDGIIIYYFSVCILFIYYPIYSYVSRVKTFFNLYSWTFSLYFRNHKYVFTT